MESLILAQNERWRRGLGMQVEREFYDSQEYGVVGLEFEDETIRGFYHWENGQMVTSTPGGIGMGILPTLDISAFLPDVTEKLSAWSYQRIMSGRLTLALFRRLALLFQRPFVREGRIRRLPFPPFSRWTRARDMPVMAPKTFRQLWDQKLSKEQ